MTLGVCRVVRGNKLKDGFAVCVRSRGVPVALAVNASGTAMSHACKKAVVRFVEDLTQDEAADIVRTTMRRATRVSA